MKSKKQVQTKGSKLFFSLNSKFMPLKDIKKGNKKGWQVGNITIFMNKKNKSIKNMLCKELKIKKYVFKDNRLSLKKRK